MFRLIGKSLVVGALGVGALSCLYGKDQVLDWFHHGKQKLEAKIDEFQGMSSELARIQESVHSLEGEVRELKEQSIREEVEVDHLKQETNDRQTGIDKLRKNLEKAQTLLATEGDRFLIAGQNYARADVERDIAEKIDLYKVQQETLAQLRQTLQVHESALVMARENVTRGEQLKGELGGKVRLLQAKLEKHRAKEVYAEAVASDFDSNEFNTEIGNVRSLFSKFETKLEVKGRMLDERMKVSSATRVGGIDYEASDRPAATNVAEKLSQLLGTSPAAAPAAVVVIQGR